MTLKCTVDGRPEDSNHVIFVCHHCGRPVCEQHGLVVSADDAFDDSGDEPDRRIPQSAAHTAKRPQAAMHCKQCIEKDHPRARSHPGWTDPREAQRSAQVQPRAAQPAVAGQQHPMTQPQAPWPRQPGQQQPDQQQGRATGRP
jgi:hypothetical protein